VKILLVHNAYQQAGGEDVVFESEKGMLARAGHQVITYTRSNAELQNASLLDRISIAPRMIWSSATRRDFAALLDSEGPELVHVHNTFMLISPSIYSACQERGIPVVQTLHNFRLLCPASNFYRHGQICEECLEHTLLRSVIHGCYRNSRTATAGIAVMLAFHNRLKTWQESITRFIALTQFAKNKFVAAGFPEDKFVVKPNFVDPDAGERIGIGEYAVFIGRLAEDKGLRVLLNAWKQLRVRYPLQIIGDGPLRSYLEEQARTSRLSEITFRGHLPHESAVEVLKNARFLIVPSAWYETFGMCIVEAFACGVPVLCSRLGAMEELVDDNRTGLHFTPNDARDLARKVEWLWNHPADLARMGRAARAQYQARFTPETNYAQLIQIYQQALAAHAFQPRRGVALQQAEHQN
jgi:glycosyltransferase involved in cell wall biosynthesis